MNSYDISIQHNLRKNILNDLMEKESSTLDIYENIEFIDELLYALGSYKEEGTFNESTINESFEIVLNFLKNNCDPYYEILKGIMYDSFTYNQYLPASFCFDERKNHRTINIPAKNTTADAYTIIHELMHYINSYSELRAEARIFLGEGISMASEKTLSLSINDETRQNQKHNQNLRYLNKCKLKLLLMKNYKTNKGIDFDKLFSMGISEKELTGYLNTIVLNFEPSYKTYLKYINGFLISSVVDDFDKVYYMNQSLAKKKSLEEILKSFDIESNGLTLTRNSIKKIYK